MDVRVCYCLHGYINAIFDFIGYNVVYRIIMFHVKHFL